MRTYIILTIVLGSLLCGVAATHADAPDDCSQAQMVSTGGQIGGAISTVGDVDWYKLVIPAGFTAYVGVFPFGGLDAVVETYINCNTWAVTTNRFAADGFESSIERASPSAATEVFIKIRGTDGPGATGGYTLDVRYQAGAGPVCDIWMSQDSFRAGDTFRVSMSVANYTNSPAAIRWYFALQVLGEFYFYPNFSAEAVPQSADVSVFQVQSFPDLVLFPVPEGIGFLGTCEAYGLAINTTSGLISNLGYDQFRFED